MLHDLMVWGSSYPSVRRPIIQLWRKFERLKRATLAEAVLVVRNQEGRVLVLPSSSGALGLPTNELHAWEPITTQVEEWLQQLLQEHSPPSLMAVHGTPGKRGIAFLYAATAEMSSDSGDQLWLDPSVAVAALSDDDNRLLRLCARRPSA